MTIYRRLLSREKLHATKENTSSPFQRIAIYPASEQIRAEERVNLQHEWNESPFRLQNLSQIPLLNATHSVSKGHEQSNVNSSFDSDRYSIQRFSHQAKETLLQHRDELSNQKQQRIDGHPTQTNNSRTHTEECGCSSCSLPLQLMEVDEDEKFIWKELSSDEESDDEWDPSQEAEEPLEQDDYLSSKLRKQLSFDFQAKAWMKQDTPKKNGQYICHICSQAIKNGQKVDMDHIPAWQDRVKAFWKVTKPTNADDIDILVLKNLYNMRGSVFAHASCNRSHSGEGNWKQLWSSVVDWYNSGGGAAIDKKRY